MQDLELHQHETNDANEYCQGSEIRAVVALSNQRKRVGHEEGQRLFVESSRLLDADGFDLEATPRDREDAEADDDEQDSDYRSCGCVYGTNVVCRCSPNEQDRRERCTR